MLRFAGERNFEDHCACITRAVALMDTGEFEAAIDQLDTALVHGESPNARWNRSLALLSVGRYLEGWEDFRSRLALFPQWTRGDQLRRDLPQWGGEPLDHKRLILYHEAGFGDSIMLLRYVRVLREQGITVALAMPPELERFAGQLAPLVLELSEHDVGCSTYDLMPVLRQTPQTIPIGPYLKIGATTLSQWRALLGRQPMIGVAWSSMRETHKHRNMALAEFRELLDAPNTKLISLQTHDQEDARANGIVTPAFRDFADVAAVASLMNMIVCVDTAALHVAGAIGHPFTFAMLPYVSCWRWRNGNPWHPQVRLCTQDSIGDWPSAFRKLQQWSIPLSKC